MTIGQKMRFYRTAEGYTQADIAGLLGVERSTYTYYETGKTQPDLRAVLILSRFYGITMELLADDGQIPLAERNFCRQNKKTAQKENVFHRIIGRESSCVLEKGVLE